MSFAFRDSSVVIIETACTSVRAIIGLPELLKLPSVEIEARVGLKRTGESSTQPQLHVNDYLVGHKLNEALEAGDDVAVSYPFLNNDIKDYKAAEAIWKYILFDQLKLKRTQNESPVLLTFPHGLPRDAHERVCQIFFERFNAAAVSTLERPLAQLYAVNALNGLVVDIGKHRTDVSPIYECAVQHNCVDYVPIGIEDCERYLVTLLKGNEQVVQTLSPPEAPLSEDQLNAELRAFVEYLWKDGHIRLGEVEVGAAEEEGVTNIAAVLVAGKEKSVIEANQKKRSNQKTTAAEQARAREIEALDLITVTFKEKELTVGRERHRFLDPLFDPRLISGVRGFEQKRWPGGCVLPLQDVCGQAVAKADLDARLVIWNAMFVTGDVTSAVKGVGTALRSRLLHYMLGSEIQTDAQAKHVRVVHIPEYFAEYREQGDRYAAFLGASIVAKVIFSDPNGKNFVSKADYGSKGPRAILEMSASLL